jgi:thiol-disulfide isomerase/thioredoxin
MKLRFLAIVALALLAGLAGLVVSIGINGPGPLAGTVVGRWLGERVGPEPRTPAGVSPAEEGESVGPLQLTDLEGRSLPLPAGRRTIVNVWASWCAPCRAEMPLLSDFARLQDANGVAVVGIAEDNPGAVRNYLQRTPVNYPILLDDAQWQAGTRIGNRLGVLPFTAMVDADGRLLKRQYGPFADAKALREWASRP